MNRQQGNFLLLNNAKFEVKKAARNGLWR